MPIYEFRCEDCRQRVSVLTLRASATPDAPCEHCGSRRLTRLLSRFALPKSAEARLDALADPANLGDLDESDPRSMGRWVRRMGEAMGDEVPRDELDSMVDEIESGPAGDSPDDGGDAGSNLEG